MTTAALTPVQLIKYEDGEFETAIGSMTVKDLYETISVLQTEMTKEQQNFNSLSSELGNLKKNSAQYKQVSKDMTASQTRLTLLMNRSMKCFSQQGNQQGKSSGLRKSTGSQSTGNLSQIQHRHSNQETTEQTEKISTRLPHSDRQSVPISLQSVQTQLAGLKQTAKPDAKKEPVFSSAHVRRAQSVSNPIKRTSLEVKQERSENRTNRPSSVDIKSLKSVFSEAKQVFSVPPAQKSAHSVQTGKSTNTTHNVVSSGDFKPTSTAGVAKTETLTNGTTTDSQLKANTLKKDDLKEQQSVSKTSKTVVDVKKFQSEDKKVNADKTKEEDTNGVQETSQISSAGKVSVGPLSNSQSRGISKSSDHISVMSVSGDKPQPEIVKGSKTSKPRTMIVMNADKQAIDLDSFTDRKNMLSELKNFKAELKPVSKQEPKKQDIDSGYSAEPENTSKQQKANLFAEIKQAKKPSEIKPETEHVPRPAGDIEVQVNTDVAQAEAADMPKQLQMFDDLLKDENNDAVDSVPDTREVISTQEVTPTIQGQATLNESNGGEERIDLSEEESRYVSEIRFEQNRQNKQGENKELDSKTAGVDVSQKDPGAVAASTSSHGNQDDDDDLVQARVNLSHWDPTTLLSDLYKVRMMPDQAVDISHKFIGMEGLMEKLPMNKKKATLLKTWKRRFFKAKDGWLHYYETSNRDKPSDSLQLMGGKVEELGPRVLGVDDGRGKYLMVRVPTDHEYGQWKVALESQTADNVKSTYVRPVVSSPPHRGKKVVVIDIGSSGIRAGVLGEKPTLPQIFFPTVVAINKQTGEVTVGSDAYHPDIRRVSTISHPVQPTNKVDKFNIDMDVMPQIFQKVFSDLDINPQHYLLMLSTPQSLGDRLKEALMKIAIDQFHMAGVCMVQQALLSLYSYNAMSGIIVDLGERMEILPIYEGVLIEGGVSHQAYGGGKVHDSLHLSLLENKYKFNTPVEKIIVRFICEQACYVAENYKEAKAGCDKDAESYQTTVYLSNYNLPDGAYMSVSLDYGAFKSPEGFFNTDLWGMDYPNLHKLINKAIQVCPMDSRKQMYRSVYLSGGVTMIPGFAERLQEELKKLAPPSVVVEVHASPQRYHAAFIGACAVASMDVFEQSCVSAQEWKQLGVKACRKWGTS